MDYSTAHGSPYDRGYCDRHYSRPYNPHYYSTGGLLFDKDRVDLFDMTPAQIAAYNAGYADAIGDLKEWGLDII